MYPPASQRADINSALIRQSVFQVNASKKSDIPKLKDLMIDYEKNALPVDNEQLNADLYTKLMEVASVRNATLKKQNKV